MHQIVFWSPDSDYRKWSEADCLRRFKRGEFYLLDGRNRVAAQKQNLIAAELRAQPEKSNRVIAKQINVDHKTVGAVRERLASTGEISRLDKTVGTDGRARAASPRTTATVPS
jgi:hypothetical protein